MADQEFWYRYVDARVHNGGYDIDGDPLPGYSMRVYLRKYVVLKTTPCGVWVKDGHGVGREFLWSEKRFILRSARKRFACPTVEEAKKSFIARKRRQAGIHYARARDAEAAIRAVDSKFMFEVVEEVEA